MHLTTLDQAPERTRELQQLGDSSWPGFLLHGDVRNWSSLFSELAAFQILVLEKGRLLGAGLTAPFPWHRERPLPRTIDAVLHEAGWPLREPGALCALAALVVPEHRGRGLSRELLTGMRELAVSHDLWGVLAPVRPTRKQEFPRMPIEEYADRRRKDGRLWDPWLRVHEDLGARRLGIARAALTVRGSVAGWAAWTEREFPESGSHEIPGGLVPVEIDLAADVGTYVEPNVWYFHDTRAVDGAKHRLREDPRD